MTTKMQGKTKRKPKVGHIRQVKVSSIRPAPENERVYRPIDPAYPDIQSLAENIGQHGVLTPLLISADGWLISGHRRLAAAQVAGLIKVQCQVHPIRRDRDPDGFLALLVATNDSREKTLAEKVNEQLVATTQEQKEAVLYEYTRSRAALEVEQLGLGESKNRKEITDAKEPLLVGIETILDQERETGAITLRRLHYLLLNDPPLRHAAKSGSTYANDLRSYHDLSDLVTRARLAGRIPWDAIDDETRPFVQCRTHPEAGSYFRAQLDRFLMSYCRDLQQSQPNWIEVVCEKVGLVGILSPVTMEYSIPLTAGAGYASITPRRQMAERFYRSGREQLVVLLLSDLDPDGVTIAESFARSMRDDFGITNLVPVRVALTPEQVQELGLPPKMKAKQSSSNYQKFANEHGDDVWELESIPTKNMQTILREAIEAVLDCDAYGREIAQERDEAVKLSAIRQQTLELLKDARIGHLLGGIDDEQ